MMVNMDKGRTELFVCWLGIAFCFFLLVDSAANISADSLITPENKASSHHLKLHVTDNHVEMDNGIVKVLLMKPQGQIAGVKYKGIDNVLERRNKEKQRGYWDIVWGRPDIGTGGFDTLSATSFRVVANTKDQIEVSFTKNWNGDDDYPPVNIDKRFVMLPGSSGFYSYAIYEHMEGWPPLHLDESRIAFKLDKERFHYMSISDERQRIMPRGASDRSSGHPLDYKEAVLLTNPADPQLKGEVDDKYQYSCDNKDNRVHGWISSKPHVGFWVITPSDEFRAGGPIKPDLTSHAGPTSLAIFFSDHYAGSKVIGVKLEDGEHWKKVFGPVFIYLNSDSGNNHTTLWRDAKRQYSAEAKKWPYNFPKSRDFPRSDKRGTISGRLLVRDKYISRELIPAKSAYIGLAPPGDAGSWQAESKGYQFWTRTNETGHFTIDAVRADTYKLYGWIPGIMGDYKHDIDVTIKPGSQIQLGELVFDPPRNGPTLWEIGIPDRTAAEFYIPDPSPGLENKLYINSTEDKFRQYGLWNRYTDLYPTEDLVYTVGESDYSKDWFFAHVTRRIENNSRTATTWRIQFDVRNVRRPGTYTLRLALASANFAEIQVRINNQNSRRPHFTTRRIGRDNAIARHGIHGQYLSYNVNISGFQLVNGRNTIYLRQSRTGNLFTGVMYDYLRLEGPPQDDHE